MNFFGKVFHTTGHVIAWLLSRGIPAADALLQSPAAGAIAAAVAGARGTEALAAEHAIVGGILAAKSSLGDAFTTKFADLVKDDAAVQAVESLFKQFEALLHPAPATK